MATISEMMVRISADNEDLKSGLQDAGKQTEGLGKKAGNMGKKVAKGTAVAGAATAGLGAATFAMVENVTSGYDDIAKGAERLGVSTDAYQEMEYWASQNGISHQQMEKTIGRFNQRVGQAQNGNEKYSSALQQLGVDMEGVRSGTVSTKDAFSKSIQTLSKMESEQDKVNLATEMFGTKTARDLLPALNNGSLSMEEASKKAQELGIVMDEETLKAGEKFQDTWDDLKRTLGLFGQQIANELMPIIQQFMDWLLENLPAIKEIFGTVFEAIGVVLGGFKDTIMAIIETVQQWFEGNSETMTQLQEMFQEKMGQIKEIITTIWTSIKEFWDENGQAIFEGAKETFTNIKDIIEEIITAVWEVIESILTTIKEIWKENGEEILNNAKSAFESIKETIDTALNAVKDIIEQVLDLVVPFIQSQLEKIQKFWDENGEKIMNAVDNAFSFIQGVIEFVMPIIQGIIEGAWSIIESVFDTAMDVIMGLVDTFASLLTGDFEGAKEALTGIWEDLWDGIKGVVEGAWDLVSGAFEGLWDSIWDWFTGLKDDALDWGKNMIDGFIDGIKSKVDDVKSAVSGVVDGAKDFIGFGSPTKKGEGRHIIDWGENMIDGLNDGIQNATPMIEASLNKAVGQSEPSQSQSATTHDNREVNITVDAGNLSEVEQVVEFFSGLKQQARAY